MKFKLTTFLLFCCYISSLNATSVAKIPADLSALPLEPYLEVLNSDTATTLETAMAGTFTPLSGEFLFTPYFGHDLWARIRLSSPNETSPTLLINRPFHIFLECFLHETTTGTTQKIQQSPFLAGNSLPCFPLSLVPGQEYELYLHLNNHGSVGIHPVSLLSRSELLRSFQSRSLINGTYFGAMLLILLVSIYVFWLTKRWEIFFYTLYLFFSTLFQIINDGYLYALWFSQHPEYNPILLSVMLACGIFCGVRVFTLSFQEHRGPTMARIGKIISIVCLAFVPLAFFPEINKVLIFLNNFTVLGGILYLTVSALILALKKIPFASTYFVAYLFLLIGIMSHIFLTVGWINLPAWPISPLKICLLLEFLLLAAGLIDLVLAQIRDSQQKSLQAMQELHATQLRLLSSRINPHFIYNSLASIQNQVLTQDKLVATDYIAKFAKLLRKTFDYSSRPLLSLSEDLEHLKLYVSLEELRTSNQFEFEVHLADNLQAEAVQVPNMIFQPLIENAIWHGVRGLSRKGKIRLHLARQADQLLVRVEDNGIGREASAAQVRLRSKDGPTGLRVTAARIRMHNGWPENREVFQFQDVKDEAGQVAGTVVEFSLRIPEPAADHSTRR